jgi:alcohol dehydrogenase YqhD (iron-dependent ADH family)
MNQESLLFYASGLDPNVNHTLQVINEDGSDLSLNVGGFSVFSAGSAIRDACLYAGHSFTLKQVALYRRLQRLQHRHLSVHLRLFGKGPLQL